MGMFDGMAESPMVKSMVEEVIDVVGIKAKYLPRKYRNVDEIFGEDPVSYFDQVWNVTIIIDEYKDFGDVGDFYSKFGVQVNDEMRLTISKAGFATAAGDASETPDVGDLIWFNEADENRGGALFEVTFRNEDGLFYPNPEFPSTVWTLTLKPWEYGYEELNTTDADIENLESEIEQSINQELGLPDWDAADDDVLDFSEMNPFGTVS